MEVFVFKTNVRYKKQVNAVASRLNSIANIKRWNFDLHDADRILRIEARNLSPGIIETILQQEGYYCIELHE